MVNTVTAPLIELQNVGKQYGSTNVLRDINVTLQPGEIHGLLGENGAGKSTLLKILGGSIAASTGTIHFDGKEVKLGHPRQAIENGVSLIAQELALVPDRSILENVFLGNWNHRGGFVLQEPDRQVFSDLCERVGFQFDPDQKVRELSVGEAQQVEILKALARGSRVLCLDEPTAALSESESEKLLVILKELAASGTTIIIVSHFLEEVLSLADSITVLRDGNQIITESAEGHSPNSLISLMVGRNVEALTRPPQPFASDAPIRLQVSGLTNANISDISFEVRAGEVLGLVGLVGSGRSEVLNAIFGSERLSAGSVSVEGALTRQNSVKHATKAGIALVPESRKEQGLSLPRSAYENIALPVLGKYQRFGFVQNKRERQRVGEVARMVDIRGEIHSIPVEALSGGNQQKVLFAKWLMDPPKVFLIDEPTRGVDIAAKVNIHHLILDLAEAGTAVVVASSELEEVMSLSHRLVVMNQGQIVAEFDRTATSDEVMSAAFM